MDTPRIRTKASVPVAGQKGDQAEEQHCGDGRTHEPAPALVSLVCADAYVGPAESDGPRGEGRGQPEHPGRHAKVLDYPDGQIERYGELDRGVAQVVGVPSEASASAGSPGMLSRVGCAL